MTENKDSVGTALVGLFSGRGASGTFIDERPEGFSSMCDESGPFFARATDLGAVLTGKELGLADAVPEVSFGPGFGSALCGNAVTGAGWGLYW